MEKKTALKRTSLYVSGTSPVNMTQAVFYNEDCLVYDLEDSVPAAEKDTARLLVYHTVRYHRPKDKYVLIRVNGLYSEYLEDDLQMAVRAQPDAIRLPKVESAEEVRHISARIGKIEQDAGVPAGGITLWCNIESYLGVLRAEIGFDVAPERDLGVLRAEEIAKADPRVEALALGAEDLTVSMNAFRTKKGLEIFYARNAILLACRSAGIDAIDAVFSDINDLDGLREDTMLIKNLGFDGKTAVHPRQLDIINSFFTPSEKDIRYALRVLAVVEEGKRQHKGAVTLDGSMIDKPMERRANNTLLQARAAGIRIGEENA